jgi:hypothetical protein
MSGPAAEELDEGIIREKFLFGLSVRTNKIYKREVKERGMGGLRTWSGDEGRRKEVVR